MRAVSKRRMTQDKPASGAVDDHGYPAFVEPANTRVRRRVARTRHGGCHPIEPGDVYLEWTEFPGGDAGYADHAGHPVRMAECGACARRYGRAALLEAS